MTLLTAVPFAPIALILHCLFIFVFKRWLGPIATFYGSISVFFISISCLFFEFYFFLLNGMYSYVDLGRWFFCLDLIDSNLLFCVDGLALVASILVMFLTSFALYFGVEYMYREAFINRLLYLLNLFATSVVFLFYVYDFFLILFAWECIGLFSFLLVNFYSSRIYTIKAALKTFVFSRISDMFMFLAFLLTINTFATTDLSLIFSQIPFLAFHYIFIGDCAIHFLTLFSFSLVTSGVIKAAQFFFHVWLPDAMEAPTPASALIHSSTLVVAGVFLVIRFAVLFEFTLFTNYYLILLGALTLSFGAITATFQIDIKKLVAYSTISQIGYLVCGCGFGCYEEVLLYLIIHALNKAFLFVLVGYIVHFFTGNTDMRRMGGAYLYSLDISTLLFGVCFNLAGLPYSAGFIGKEFLLIQVMRDDFISLFVRGCWLVSFFFTPIYMLLLVFIVLFNIRKGPTVIFSHSWVFNATKSLYLVVRERVIFLKNFDLHKKWLTPTAFYYNFTAVTSRSTSYFLFLFWCFFFFYGESLILILFNFSTPTDTILSSSFVLIKQHIIFFLLSSSTKLLNFINLCIFFLTLSAFLFLLNLNYHHAYLYFRQSTTISALTTTLSVAYLLAFF